MLLLMRGFCNFKLIKTRGGALMAGHGLPTDEIDLAVCESVGYELMNEDGEGSSVSGLKIPRGGLRS